MSTFQNKSFAQAQKLQRGVIWFKFVSKEILLTGQKLHLNNLHGSRVIKTFFSGRGVYKFEGLSTTF